MLRALKTRSTPPSAHINAHNLLKNVRELPKDAVLADVVRSLESSLRSRGHLPLNGLRDFYPLWFLVETERNIFLWRNGCSLTEADEFEFWVDLSKLTEKRISQLEGFTPENPFFNPLWGSFVPDSKSAAQEKIYLEQFAELTEKMSDHLHALSRVGSMMFQEGAEELEARKVVILPG